MYVRYAHTTLLQIDENPIETAFWTLAPGAQLSGGVFGDKLAHFGVQIDLTFVLVKGLLNFSSGSANLRNTR